MIRPGEPSIAELMAQLAANAAEIAALKAEKEALSARVVKLEEELALKIDPSCAIYLGHFSAPAANEPGFEVLAELFLIQTEQTVTPAAEIEEVQWIDPANDGGLMLAPLTRDVILPFYRNSVKAPA